MPCKCLIIGAGPIGLEAALACLQYGHTVTIIERGRPAEHIFKWRHVTLFSPFEMNSSVLGRETLTATGHQLPKANQILTAEQFREVYLIPLANYVSQHGNVLFNTTAEQITRNATTKSDLIGNSLRSVQPFRILINSLKGEEILTADVVLDCSGTYGNHNWLGSGGIPCPGEREYTSQIRYDLPDFHGDDQEQFAGKTTLIIGSGYSSATNVVSLATLKEEYPETHILWGTRHNHNDPMHRIDNDVLAVRDNLSQRANALVESGTVQWLKGIAIDEIQSENRDSFLNVLISRNSNQETLQVHNIIANVGYKPDRKLYEELQIHECYATGGPMKLAAALLGETSPDCLAQSSPIANTLLNPEPNFFILGAKSYGRNSRFLIKTGLEQIEHVLNLLKESKESQ